MQVGKVCGYNYFLSAVRITDSYDSKSRATCGQLADIFQGLEKEEKAEGEHSGIILGSLYVSGGDGADCDIQLCASVLCIDVL